MTETTKISEKEQLAAQVQVQALENVGRPVDPLLRRIASGGRPPSPQVPQQPREVPQQRERAARASQTVRWPAKTVRKVTPAEGYIKRLESELRRTRQQLQVERRRNSEQAGVERSRAARHDPARGRGDDGLGQGL